MQIFVFGEPVNVFTSLHHVNAKQWRKYAYLHYNNHFAPRFLLLAFRTANKKKAINIAQKIYDVTTFQQWFQRNEMSREQTVSIKESRTFDNYSAFMRILTNNIDAKVCLFVTLSGLKHWTYLTEF